MKILHIVKKEPDHITDVLISAMGAPDEKEGMTIFRLYNEQIDYEKLIDLIFEHDSVISWW